MRAYGGDLADFEAFCAEKGIASAEFIDRRLIRAYIAALQERGRRRSSTLRRLYCLKSFCGFLRECGVLKGDPFLNVPLPKKENRLPRYLTEAEVASLLPPGGSPPAAADPVLGLRDRAMLELLYSTGIRRSELCGLDVADVDFVAGTVRVFGKGSRERIAPVGAAALRALREHLDSRPAGTQRGGGPLFANSRGRRLSDKGLYFILRRWTKAAGFLKGVTPHMLRHSFATHLVNGGCDIKTVQELLGHRNLLNTQIYTHMSLERLRKVYKDSHPRASAG